MACTVGLLGGSFDPIHIGHLLIARFVAEALSMQEVVFLPSAHPPHKSPADLVGIDDRLAMVRAAIKGEPLFSVDDWDARQRGPTFTIHTVEHFKSVRPADTALCWIVGSDSLAELHTWKDVARLIESCRIVTVRRPGADSPDLASLRALAPPVAVDRLTRDIVETPRIDISSTDIRQRVQAGRSIRYLVPDCVREHILSRGLYRAGA